LVGGIDVVGVKRTEERYGEQIILTIDTSLSKDSEKTFYSTSNTHTTIIEKNVFRGIGLEGSMGIMYSFGKRWALLADYRANLVVGKGTSHYREVVSGTNRKNKFTNFEFEGGPLLTEVTLLYKF
jgi:hypothetical protein